MDIAALLKLIWPLIVIQLGAQIYALYHLYHNRQTRNLSAAAWALIIILGEILGPILYFLLGSSEEERG